MRDTILIAMAYMAALFSIAIVASWLLTHALAPVQFIGGGW